jgi:hypothetical protein
MLWNALMQALSTVPTSLRDHVTLDLPNRRIRFSDAIVMRAVRMAASRAGWELLEITRSEGGYACSARKGKELVRGTAAVTRITWSGRRIEVALSTPAPIELASRPVMNFIVAAIVGPLGGTKLAEQILAGGLPEGAQWNGRDARFTFLLPDDVVLPEWVERNASLVFDVAQDDGLWLKVSDGVSLPELLEAVYQHLFKLFFPPFS